MSEFYDHKSIEQKWQKQWEKGHLHEADEDARIPKEKRRYVLDMFPYPSAAGLHVGHPEGYTATDIYSRYLRMRGFHVLHPMGWDAFGLPAENYAIKERVHPRESTWKNIDTFRRQIRRIGFSYDWSREINTAEPEYYRWTQWFFLFLYKRGLAYRKKAPVNWCASCQTVLAREQVVDGGCERCRNEVVQKELEQWFFKITEYADRLLSDLAKIDWPEPIKLMQRNWIGKSDGAVIKFKVKSEKLKIDEYIEVFTTRPDTIFGATYLVVAPEHRIITNYELRITNYGKAEEYIQKAKKKTELQRTDLAKEKTGVELQGVRAIHPVTGEEISIWIADYVLVSYGTGAIMGVPAHDSRDFEFASEYGLPIRRVIAQKIKDPGNSGSFSGSSDAVVLTYHWHDKNSITQPLRYVKRQDSVAPAPGFAPGDPIMPVISQHYAADQNATPNRVYQTSRGDVKEAYTGEGTLVNSGEFSGMRSDEARGKIVSWLEERGSAHISVQYKLRDWLISRQRYWGAPIPIIYCPSCGEVPVPEKDLPVLLPNDVDFRPTGESPLTRSESFHNVSCPKCGKTARRESDTMDTFVCSSWYLYRYTDPRNDCEFASKEKMAYWLPVDLYVGGAEHAVMHLLYARFLAKTLYDAEYIFFDEPFAKLINQGLIIGEDGQKMSKSRGNVINPDDVVAEYGADCLRMYEMFMGPFEDAKPWSTRGIMGIRRFLEKVWTFIASMTDDQQDVQELSLRGAKRRSNLVFKPREDCFASLAMTKTAFSDSLSNPKSQTLEHLLHKTIKKVTEDIESFKFNTAISQMMIFVNEFQKQKGDLDTVRYKLFASNFLFLLAPFAPHIAEELWSRMGYTDSIFKSAWPSYDEMILIEETITVVVEVNGKVRGQIGVPRDASETYVISAARENEKVAKFLAGKKVKREVYVKGRVVNFVVE